MKDYNNFHRPNPELFNSTDAKFFPEPFKGEEAGR